MLPRTSIPILALGAALALGSPGCTSEAPGKGDKKAAADPAAKKRRQELEKKVEIVSNALAKNPLSKDTTVRDLDAYAGEAQREGWADIAQKCASLKEDAQRSFEAAAEKEIKDACDLAKKYATEGEFKKAHNRLNGLHKNLQKDARYADRAAAARKEVEQIERADRYYDKVTKAKAAGFKAQGEFERALGVLEAFLLVPARAESARAREVEKQIAEVRPEAEKARAVRESEQKILPIPAFRGKADDLNQWNYDDPQAANEVGGIIVFKHEIDEYKYIKMEFGEEDWEDYVVDFQFRIVKGPEAFFCVRGFQESEEAKQREWDKVKVDASECPDKERWYKLRLDVRGKKMLVTRSGSYPLPKDLKMPRGPFMVAIPKGGEVHLKSVWVKVLKKAAGK